MKKSLMAALALAVLCGTVSAADTVSTPSTSERLTAARKAIEAKDWSRAKTELDAALREDPRNADVHNLLGYSYRNLKRYDESLVAYKRALTLDPKHRGAHEYIGIAYIQMGQPAKAREHLDALNNICFFSCEEYRDLKQALDEAAKTPAQ